jgi:hypothetical protein
MAREGLRSAWGCKLMTGACGKSNYLVDMSD